MAWSSAPWASPVATAAIPSRLAATARGSAAPVASAAKAVSFRTPTNISISASCSRCATSASDVAAIGAELDDHINVQAHAVER